LARLLNIRLNLDWFEESLVKGKFLLSILALSLPLSLAGQVSKPTAPTDAAASLQKYELFAGFDYSGANQVKGSSALLGGNVGAAFKLKPWFGGTADFGQYGASSGVAKPTVTTFLAGPEFYIPSEKLTGILHVMFGGAHTGGVTSTPDISFAYAVGGGVEYNISNRWSIRATGDAILSSFVQAAASTGDSPHLRSNGRASGGVAYHF
jgi:opacity protein-like surface antigen